MQISEENVKIIGWHPQFWGWRTPSGKSWYPPLTWDCYQKKLIKIDFQRYLQLKIEVNIEYNCDNYQLQCWNRSKMLTIDELLQALQKEKND